MINQPIVTEEDGYSVTTYPNGNSIKVLKSDPDLLKQMEAEQNNNEQIENNA